MDEKKTVRRAKNKAHPLALRKNPLDHTEEISFNYTEAERNAVRYFLIYKNKKEAYFVYRAARDPLNEVQANKATIDRSVERFFESDKIKQLLSIEEGNIFEFITTLAKKYGMNTYKIGDKNSLAGIGDTGKGVVSKEDTIQILANILDANRTDPAVISTIVPKLTDLMGWKKQTEKEQSNLSFYELPKRQ